MVLDWQGIGNVRAINVRELSEARGLDGRADTYPCLDLKIMIDNWFLQ